MPSATLRGEFLEFRQDVKPKEQHKIFHDIAVRLFGLA